MAAKGSKRSPGRREVFGPKQPPAPVARASESSADPPVAPPEVVPKPSLDAVPKDTPPTFFEATQKALQVVGLSLQPSAEPTVVVADAAPPSPAYRGGAGGGLSMTSPFTGDATLVQPSPRPTPPSAEVAPPTSRAYTCEEVPEDLRELNDLAQAYLREEPSEPEQVIELPVHVETPPPCRRGHVRAKVIAPGSLNATGFTLDGEYRTNWAKGDVGEFPKTSVDGIYLEAL